MSVTRKALLTIIVVLVIVVWFAALVHDIREFNSRRSLRYKANNYLLALPKLQPPEELHHAYVSYSSRDGGAEQALDMTRQLEQSAACQNTATVSRRPQRQPATRAVTRIVYIHRDVDGHLRETHQAHDEGDGQKVWYHRDEPEL